MAGATVSGRAEHSPIGLAFLSVDKVVCRFKEAGGAQATANSNADQYGGSTLARGGKKKRRGRHGARDGR